MTGLKQLCQHCHSSVASVVCPFCGRSICSSCLAAVNSGRTCPLMVKK